jgi:hypothetical protein
MGPSRSRNSTRARKAHPRSSQSQRKTTAPQTPIIRPAIDMLCDAKRILVGDPAKKLRITATLAVAIREIRERLETALSVTSLCVIALKAQAADHDIDIALCLDRCVERVIANEMEQLEHVLKGAAS